ncbi:copper resistance CopC family protein [Plantibacter sp. ME-Dv--P-122b]|uniref:copper resistance CopC family protein n=1 Tax=Plantibacter sp. ME-Dv--P-122b TaxID=3040300 RepID=UPI00254EF0DC|nr:copper resistance CopC family protein [Plantibacter sp. ME-Dv--P-122b]
MTVSRRRRFVGTAATAFLAVAAVLAVAQPASAHNTIVSTTPAEGSTITEQPEQLVITTNDNLLDLGDAGQSNQIQVTGPGDERLYYGSACAAVNGPALVMPLQLGEAGEYTVVWQLVSTDGHPLSGSYTFEWAPAEGQELAAGSEKPACATSGASTVEPSSEAGGVEPQSSSDGGLSGDVWWIVGAIGVVLIAGIGVLLVTRRKPEAPSDDQGTDTSAP